MQYIDIWKGSCLHLISRGPRSSSEERGLFSTRGNFMGGNVYLRPDYVLYIHPSAYLALTEQNKYAVARAVGELNRKLPRGSMLLMGPGRWGTSTPSLGVPVHFTEINRAAALCEVAYRAGGLRRSPPSFRSCIWPICRASRCTPMSRHRRSPVIWLIPERG